MKYIQNLCAIFLKMFDGVEQPLIIFHVILLRKIEAQLSRPLLALRLEEYWFCISHYVYDRNRPLTPILGQRQCSLMYDVYRLAQMMMVLLVQWYSRIKIPGIQSRIRIESFFFEQQTMNNEKAKESNKKKSRTKTNKNLNESRTTTKSIEQQ